MTHDICRECECVSHCIQHGCIPITVEAKKPTKDYIMNISFIGLLTIAFIVLKIVGFITWSWWWVLSPLWIGFVVMSILFLIAMLYSAVSKAWCR